MGCAPSKEGATVKAVDLQAVNGSQSRSTGASKSVLREAVETGSYSKMASYKPDPRCPLTERQLYSITKSWKAINREMASTAVNMFIRDYGLFSITNEVLKSIVLLRFGRLSCAINRLLEHDGIRSFFTKFKDHKTVAELRASKVFESHALMVISVIDDVITNLDDMDYVMSLLQATGESHSIKFKNFNPDFLWNVEGAFLWAVKETLGDRYTISIESIYTTTIRYILQSLHDAFTKHRERQISPNNGTKKVDQKDNSLSQGLNAADLEISSLDDGKQGQKG